MLVRLEDCTRHLSIADGEEHPQHVGLSERRRHQGRRSRKRGQAAAEAQAREGVLIWAVQCIHVEIDASKFPREPIAGEVETDSRAYDHLPQKAPVIGLRLDMIGVFATLRTSHTATVAEDFPCAFRVVSWAAFQKWSPELMAVTCQPGVPQDALVPFTYVAIDPSARRWC